MRIFGRKANAQSPDVPPELAPYYAKPTLRQELVHTGLLVLPLLVVLVVLGGLVWGGWELFHRGSGSGGSGSSGLRAGQNGPTKINGSTNPNNLPTYLQTSPPASGGSSQTGSARSGKPGSTTESPATAQSQPTQPASQAAPQLVNTGPGTVIMALPAITTVLAAILFEARQQRVSRR